MRKKYYIISLVLGILDIFIYLLVIFIKNWDNQALIIIDSIFLGLNFGFLIIFVVKDIIDRIRRKKGEPPIGGTQIEHGPFVLTMSIYAVISILVFANTFFLKIILFICCITDGIWDLYQDYRTKSLH